MSIKDLMENTFDVEIRYKDSFRSPEKLGKVYDLIEGYGARIKSIRTHHYVPGRENISIMSFLVPNIEVKESIEKELREKGLAREVNEHVMVLEGAILTCKQRREKYSQ